MIRTWWPLLAITLAGWSLWGWFLDRVESDPWHLVPLGAALFLLVRRRHDTESAPPSHLATGLLLAFAVASPLLPPLLAATTLAVVAALVASPRFFACRLQPGFGALLLLSLPTLPALQLILGYPLRVVSATLAAALLRFGGVAAGRVGTILEIDSELYSVDAPCSGISMWWTALVVVAWLAARSGVSVGRALYSAGVATVLVIAGNALRSAALVQLEVSRLPAPEWFHEAVGGVAFALCVVVIVLLLGRRRGVNACSAR